MRKPRHHWKAAVGASFLALTACDGAVARVPPIGADLPQKVDQAQPAFDQRVKQRFPAGSEAAAMVSVLKQQGFEGPENWEPDFEQPSFEEHIRSMDFRSGSMFSTLWSVRWREKGGKITEIWGVYGIIAP